MFPLDPNYANEVKYRERRERGGLSKSQLEDKSVTSFVGIKKYPFSCAKTTLDIHSVINQCFQDFVTFCLVLLQIFRFSAIKHQQSQDKGKSANLSHLSGPIYGLVSQKALLHIINFLVSKKQMFASNEDSGCPHIDKEKDTRAT